MMKIAYLLMIAHNFLTERNWWPYHNFKNDILNIVAEVGELAEHFIVSNNDIERQDKIAQEMSDVLFALFTFSLMAKIDIAQAVGISIEDTRLNNEDCTYEQLQKVIIDNLNKFGLDSFCEPQQVALSLVVQTAKLADIFVWSSVEQSVTRAQEKHAQVEKYIADGMAHLIYLATLLNRDLSQEFMRKMEKNAAKYSTNIKTIEEYNAQKEACRKQR